MGSPTPTNLVDSKLKKIQNTLRCLKRKFVVAVNTIASFRLRSHYPLPPENMIELIAVSIEIES